MCTKDTYSFLVCQVLTLATFMTLPPLFPLITLCFISLRYLLFSLVHQFRVPSLVHYSLLLSCLFISSHFYFFLIHPHWDDPYLSLFSICILCLFWPLLLCLIYIFLSLFLALSTFSFSSMLFPYL